MGHGPSGTEILPTQATGPSHDRHGATGHGDDRPPHRVVDHERLSAPRGRVCLTVEGVPHPSHRPPQRRAAHRLPPGLAAGLSLGLSLGLPVSCAGCGRWETALCPQCRELLEGDPFAVEHADAAGDLDVLALATYTGPVRTMVLGWKNGSREDLSETMAQAGRRLGGSWASAHPPSGIWADPPGDRFVSGAPSAPALLVVPAPSGPTRRLRGRLVAARLADAVTQGIAGQWAHREQSARRARGPASPASPSTEPPPALVLSTDLLRRRGGGAHQAGRSSRQRRGNRAAAPRLLAPVTGLPALVVDDVVTTGATLDACARALERAGARVLGALVLTATPPPEHTSVTVPPRAPTAATDTVPRIVPTPSGLSARGDHEAPSQCGTPE